MDSSLSTPSPVLGDDISNLLSISPRLSFLNRTLVATELGSDEELLGSSTRRRLFGGVCQQSEESNPFLVSSTATPGRLSTPRLSGLNNGTNPLIYNLPTDTEAICTNKFGFPPKKEQLEVVKCIGMQKDCVLIAGCGWGKSLTYFLPLVLWENRIILILSPLKALMDEQQLKLQDYNIGSLAIHGDNKNIPPNLEDLLSQGKYRAVFMTPEMVKDRERFPKLWNMDGWRSRLLAIVIDEAHCIHSWGNSFRNAYSQIGDLRAKAPPGVPFIAMSATLPPNILHAVKTSLYFKNDVIIVKADCDRPNIKYEVRQFPTRKGCILDIIKHFMDFAKTIIYFDDITEMSKVCRYLHKEFSHKRRMIVRYFSDLSADAKRKRIREFKEGGIRVLLSTEAAGMGCDIPDVVRVIQFKCPENISTLVQRLGRAARSPSIQGHGILYTLPGKNQHQKQDRHLDAFVTTTECRRQVLNSAFGNPPASLENMKCCDICDKIKGSSGTESSLTVSNVASRIVRWKQVSTSAAHPKHVHRTKEQQQEANERILKWRNEEWARLIAQSEIYSKDSVMNMKTIAILVAKFGTVQCHGAIASIFEGRWQESEPGGQHRLEEILIRYNEEINSSNAVNSNKEQVNPQQHEEPLSSRPQDQQEILSPDRLHFPQSEPAELPSLRPSSPAQKKKALKRAKSNDMKFVHYSPNKRGKNSK